jgi:hypothetical protein
MTGINDDMDPIALVLGSEWLNETKIPTSKAFASVNELIDYVFRPSAKEIALFILGQYRQQVILWCGCGCTQEGCTPTPTSSDREYIEEKENK